MVNQADSLALCPYFRQLPSSQHTPFTLHAPTQGSRKIHFPTKNVGLPGFVKEQQNLQSDSAIHQLRSSPHRFCNVFVPVPVKHTTHVAVGRPDGRLVVVVCARGPLAVLHEDVVLFWPPLRAPDRDVGADGDVVGVIAVNNETKSCFKSIYTLGTIPVFVGGNFT